MTPALGANGWTGGQYSCFRIALGAYLAVHFAHLVPWGPEVYSAAGVLPDGNASPLFRLFPSIFLLNDSPLMVQAVLGGAVAFSLAFMIGSRDRIMAVLLWYILACLFGRNPLTANPSLPFVGWMLLAHAFIPIAPYGSWSARGRVDPSGGWRFPPALFAAAWVLMAVGYSYSGYTKLISPSWVNGTALIHVLENPLARPTCIRTMLLSLPPGLLKVATWSALALELSFTPLALFRRTRPWAWLAMTGMHVSLMVVIDFADLSLGMVMLHLFTFNPAWVKPTTHKGTSTVFYDGGCALCHGFVRFVLAEDAAGEIRLAPLDGRTIQEQVGEAQRKQLPDSICVLTPDGALLVRSKAVAHVLGRLVGLWRLFAILISCTPRPLADGSYDLIAANRRRLGKPTDACPMHPPSLKARLLP